MWGGGRVLRVSESNALNIKLMRYWLRVANFYKANTLSGSFISCYLWRLTGGVNSESLLPVERNAPAIGGESLFRLFRVCNEHCLVDL